MKTLTFALALSLAMLGGSSFAAQQQTITGEVMDSSCARMGSHEAMEKEHNMPINTAASDKACTLACVKNGAKLVLYDSATKTAYEFDDQKKAEQFAGEKVTVTGTVDQTNSTIHAAKIATTSETH